MRIAVTSQNFRTITGHAGKTRRFMIIEAGGEAAPVEVERIDLPAQMSMHDYRGDDHPLFAMRLDAIITQSAGQGFVARLSRQGISVHATSATDPLMAAGMLASGQPLPLAAPHDHDHGHGHGQRQARLRISEPSPDPDA